MSEADTAAGRMLATTTSKHVIDSLVLGGEGHYLVFDCKLEIGAYDVACAAVADVDVAESLANVILEWVAAQREVGAWEFDGEDWYRYRGSEIVATVYGFSATRTPGDLYLWSTVGAGPPPKGANGLSDDMADSIDAAKAAADTHLRAAGWVLL